MKENVNRIIEHKPDSAFFGLVFISGPDLWEMRAEKAKVGESIG
jgi:hypothetical protein